MFRGTRNERKFLRPPSPPLPRPFVDSLIAQNLQTLCAWKCWDQMLSPQCEALLSPIWAEPKITLLVCHQKHNSGTTHLLRMDGLLLWFGRSRHLGTRRCRTRLMWPESVQVNQRSQPHQFQWMIYHSPCWPCSCCWLLERTDTVVACHCLFHPRTNWLHHLKLEPIAL